MTLCDLLFLILMAAFITSREYRTREADAWVRAGQTGLAARLQGEQTLEKLGEVTAPDTRALVEGNP